MSCLFLFLFKPSELSEFYDFISTYEIIVCTHLVLRRGLDLRFQLLVIDNKKRSFIKIQDIDLQRRELGFYYLYHNYIVCKPGEFATMVIQILPYLHALLMYGLFMLASDLGLFVPAQIVKIQIALNIALIESTRISYLTFSKHRFECC